MGKYLIGLDEGTTGCKACVFDLQGNLIGSYYQEYPCIFPGKPGYIEQSDADITPALYATVRAAIVKAAIDPEEIIALGLSSQGAVVGMVDKDGRAIHNFISWQDTRGTEVMDECFAMMSREDYYAIGGLDLALPLHPITKHVWLQKNLPEVYDKADRFVTNQEFFLKQFGADGWYSDSSSICREGLADVDRHDYSEKIFDAFNMDLSKRGERAYHGAPVGEITPALAELTGLPVGCVVCVGAMDQDCSPFGCGSIRDGDTSIVMGTFGACFICSDKPVRDPNPSMLPVKSHTCFENGPDTFTIEGSSASSASAYRWFRDHFGGLEVASQAQTGMDAYDLIAMQVARSTPGANGVTFLPFLQGRMGGQTNFAARASLSGMRMSSTRADVARAVMEGICYEINEILSAEAASGVKIGEIRLTGGVTKAPMWVQMLSDVIQRPVSTLSVTENGCLGAAMFAGIGAGVYKDAYEAVDIAVKDGVTYEPDTSLRGAYEEAYARFETYYSALKNAWAVL